MAFQSKIRRTAVINAAGSGTAFGLITRLRSVWSDRVHIIALDVNPPEMITASVLVDEFHLSPLAGTPEFKIKVRELLDRHPDAVVYPMVNDDFGAYLELIREGGCNRADFVLPSPGLVSLVSDKCLVSDWLGGLGIHCPRLYSLDEALAQGAPAALFVKPRNGFGSRGATIVSREEFRRGPARLFEECIIQEICESPEVTVDAFFDPASDQGAAVCRERLEVKAGVCTKARLFLDDHLAEWGSRIGRAAAIRGSFCFQVMRRGGEWVLTDLNFRPGAGTALSVAVGADFFAAMHAARLGDDPFRFLNMAILQRGDAFVTRQYCEFVTRSPL